MNITSTISEIGILETARVVAKNDGVGYHITSYLPLYSSEYIERLASELAKRLIESGKSSLFLMLPEIALLEKLSEAKWNGSAILALLFDMDEEGKARIRANIPE